VLGLADMDWFQRLRIMTMLYPYLHIKIISKREVEDITKRQATPLKGQTM
jgi:hypothetical protein